MVYDIQSRLIKQIKQRTVRKRKIALPLILAAEQQAFVDERLRPYLESKHFYIDQYILNHRLLSRQKPQTLQQIADRFGKDVESVRQIQILLIEQIENKSVNKKQISLPLILTRADKTFIDEKLRPTLNDLEIYILDHRLLSPHTKEPREIASQFKKPVRVVYSAQDRLVKQIKQRTVRKRKIVLPLVLTAEQQAFVEEKIASLFRR